MCFVFIVKLVFIVLFSYKDIGCLVCALSCIATLFRQSELTVPLVHIAFS